MRALISVYDKTGLGDLCQWLSGQGVSLMATGGTAAFLRGQGIVVEETLEATGFQELLGGRVKTLHPAIHAGLLSRSTPEDTLSMRQAGLLPIDLLVTNLYPFRQAWCRGGDQTDLIEQIDIGGVALLRAAAKNFHRVTVLSDPAQYRTAMDRGMVGWDQAYRLSQAAYAFRLVASYDADIAEVYSHWEGNALPERLTITGDRREVLRYGENPHQRAAYYGRPGQYGLQDAVQVQGKALSYNNLADAETAWKLVWDLPGIGVVALKHQNPCGVALANSVEEAFRRARDADPVSIFGGIVAFNRTVTEAAARQLTELFLEVVIAPGWAPEALPVLAAKPNLRVLTLGAPGPAVMEWRSLTGGFLVQDQDRETAPHTAWTSVAGPSLDVAAEAAWMGDARLAWTVVRYVKSNAVVLAKDGVTVGIGGGQTNRIDAVRQALERAQGKAVGSVLASDAFFFADTVHALQEGGVTVAVSPGGSIRDKEVIREAQAAGLTLIFTGERHFRH